MEVKIHNYLAEEYCKANARISTSAGGVDQWERVVKSEW